MLMAEGRSRQLWDHTSNLVATIANGLCRKEGSRPFQPREFNPYEQPNNAPAVQLDKETTQEVLRSVFLGKKQ